jgi:hypothetical protein
LLELRKNLLEHLFSGARPDENLQDFNKKEVTKKTFWICAADQQIR